MLYPVRSNRRLRRARLAATATCATYNGGVNHPSFRGNMARYRYATRQAQHRLFRRENQLVERFDAATGEDVTFIRPE